MVLLLQQIISSAWGTSDFLNDATLGKGAKVNIWSTNIDEYLISPTFDLSGAGTHYLNIDAGITDYNGSGADADGMDVEMIMLLFFFQKMMVLHGQNYIVGILHLD